MKTIKSNQMKTLKYTIIGIVSLLLTSCHEYDEWDNNAGDNILALWQVIDEHYCYFDEKDVDWNEVKTTYLSKLESKMAYVDYYQVCADMINELKDGHVNLSTPLGTSYYRNWWSDYPQNFNLRTLQQYYLEFDYFSLGGVYYKILPSGVAYIYYPSFNTTLGERNWDYIFNYFKDCPGLIIDIRNNGGGELSNVHRLAGHFITEKQVGGYMRHKTGKGHDDFSEPYAIEYEPAESGHNIWSREKPVAILTNRACFSSANDFVAVMQYLPNVKIVGARTGGGGALPFTYDLPMGWSVRLSVSPMYDKYMNSIEDGIDPSEGCAMTSTDDDLALGRDAILDFAITMLQE